MLQNIICFYLTRSRGFDPDEPAGGKLLLADHWLKLVLDAAFLAALGLFMVRLPTKLLPLLCLWSVPQHTVKLCLLAGGYAATHRSLRTAPRPREESPRMPKEGCGERRSKIVRCLPQAAVFTVFDQVPVSIQVPLSISSYTVQALETVRMGPRSTSRSGWALRIRWFGSLMRVVTTACFLGGDLAAPHGQAPALTERPRSAPYVAPGSSVWLDAPRGRCRALGA